MLTIEQLRRLRNALFPGACESVVQVLAALGNPSRDVLVASALEALKSQDRNERVLALRILGQQSGAEAMTGILHGLNDPRRRVREVAIKSSPNYLHHPEIVARLEEIATDEGETNRLRGAALHCLGGFQAETLPKVAADVLEQLAENDQYRSQVFLQLLTLDLNDEVENLLREFVHNGSKEEAVMATKALCGYQALNLGSIPDEETRKRVSQTCDLAAGRVFYWVKRSERAGLTGANRAIQAFQ